jgi:hypothetical protein
VESLETHELEGVAAFRLESGLNDLAIGLALVIVGTFLTMTRWSDPMSRTNAEAISTLLSSLGTVLLASEAFGKDRVMRWEARVAAACSDTVEILGAFVSLFTAPWKNHDVLKEMPAWILPALGMIAIGSVVGASLLSQELGLLNVGGITAVVWVGAVLFSLLEYNLVEFFERLRRGSSRVRDRLYLMLCVIWIGLVGFLWVSLLALVLALSWPVVVFLAVLGIVVGAAKTLRAFLIWKGRLGLGNLLIWVGLVLSLSGLALGHLANRGVFGE